MKNSSARRSLPSMSTLLLTVLMAVTGCTTMQVKEVWRDDAYQARPKSILVIAVMKNATVQRMFESEFAKRLKGRGINAVESFRILPDGVSPESDAGRDAAAAAIKEQGFDAVLMTRITGRRSQKEDIPGMTITAGFGYPYGYPAGMGAYASRQLRATRAKQSSWTWKRTCSMQRPRSSSGERGPNCGSRVRRRRRSCPMSTMCPRFSCVKSSCNDHRVATYPSNSARCRLKRMHLRCYDR